MTALHEERQRSLVANGRFHVFQQCYGSFMHRIFSPGSKAAILASSVRPNRGLRAAPAAAASAAPVAVAVWSLQRGVEPLVNRHDTESISLTLFLNGLASNVAISVQIFAESGFLRKEKEKRKMVNFFQTGRKMALASHPRVSTMHEEYASRYTERKAAAFPFFLLFFPYQFVLSERAVSGALQTHKGGLTWFASDLK